MSNDPVVAIVGVTGAVGAEFIATMDRRGFRVGKLKALASARSAGRTIDFRGRQDRDRGAHRALLRRRRHRAVLGRRRHFQEVRADRREGRRRRGRQLLGLPHGSGRAAGDPRDQRRPHPGAQGHHRQSELRRDHRAGAAVADPPGQPDQARDHLDLSGGERRRCRGDGRAGGIDPRQPRTARPISQR